MSLTSDEQWVVDRLTENSAGLTFAALRDGRDIGVLATRSALASLMRAHLVQDFDGLDRFKPVYRLVTGRVIAGKGIGSPPNPVHKRPLFDGKDVTMYGVVAQEACEVIFKPMILRLLQECDPAEVERIATQAVRKIIADAS